MLTTASDFPFKRSDMDCPEYKGYKFDAVNDRLTRSSANTKEPTIYDHRKIDEGSVAKRLSVHLEKYNYI